MGYISELESAFSILLAVLVWVLQRNISNRRHTHTHRRREQDRERGRGREGGKGWGGREISYKELAHAIRKAEKSHNLLSACQRPRKADGVVQAKSKSLRTRGTNGLIPSPRAEENYCTTSSSQGEKG